ncbi:MAG: type II toxin-antitoxin system RelE/ParE family toxin [Reyranellaceae bacterium]
MIRRTVRFTPEADNDLLNIGDWIAERAGADIALSYIERLENYCLGSQANEVSGATTSVQACVSSDLSAESRLRLP